MLTTRYAFIILGCALLISACSAKSQPQSAFNWDDTNYSIGTVASKEE